MTYGSNAERKPAIRVSLWRNEYAQGERDPFAKGKLSIPLDCLAELLAEWAAGTLPVDRDGNAQLNVSAWSKKSGAHEKAPDLSGQATSPAENRDYYQRNPDKTPPQQGYANPMVPWDLPQSVQQLFGGAPAQQPQQGYQVPSHAPLPPAYQQQAPQQGYQQQAPAQQPVGAPTGRPLF
jgi:hypothetical protein